MCKSFLSLSARFPRGLEYVFRSSTAASCTRGGGEGGYRGRPFPSMYCCTATALHAPAPLYESDTLFESWTLQAREKQDWRFVQEKKFVVRAHRSLFSRRCTTYVRTHMPCKISYEVCVCARHRTTMTLWRGGGSRSNVLFYGNYVVLRSRISKCESLLLLLLPTRSVFHSRGP